ATGPGARDPAQPDGRPRPDAGDLHPLVRRRPAAGLAGAADPRLSASRPPPRGAGGRRRPSGPPPGSPGRCWSTTHRAPGAAAGPARPPPPPPLRRRRRPRGPPRRRPADARSWGLLPLCLVLATSSRADVDRDSRTPVPVTAPWLTTSSSAPP